jgi:hypothetical protein
VSGLSKTESHGGVTAPIAWVPILIGVVLVALFVRHAARAAAAHRRAPVPRDRVQRRRPRRRSSSPAHCSAG